MHLRRLRSLIVPAALGCLLLAHAAPVLAAGLPTVVALPLTADSEDGRRAGLGVAMKLNAALHDTGALNFIHPRQIFAMARGNAIDPARFGELEVARDASRHLGGSAVVFGSLSQSGGQTQLKLSVAAVKGGEPRLVELSGASAKLPELLDEAAAKVVAAAARLPELRKALGKAAKRKVSDYRAVPPATRDSGALGHYLSCYANLLDQAIGIRNPALLIADSVESAIFSCRSALEADAGFLSARATLGLAYAMIFNHIAAGDALSRVKASKKLIPEYWLGSFWLQSRYFAIYKGMQVLEKAVATWPAFLLARGYFAEVNYITGRYDVALKAFETYLAQAPGQPWVYAQLGRCKARLKDHEASMDFTAKALALDPGSPDLQLRRVSRLIDAEQVYRAEAALSELLETRAAKVARAWLRRGYLRLVRNDLERAEEDLVKAKGLATGPREWKTRALVHFDLAKIRHRQGKKSEALAELALASSEGYPLVQDRGRDKELLEMIGAANSDARHTGPIPVGANGALDLSTATGSGK